jgi:hypothetical protein
VSRRFRRHRAGSLLGESWELIGRIYDATERFLLLSKNLEHWSTAAIDEEKIAELLRAKSVRPSEQHKPFWTQLHGSEVALHSLAVRASALMEGMTEENKPAVSEDAAVQAALDRVFGKKEGG